MKEFVVITNETLISPTVASRFDKCTFLFGNTVGPTFEESNYGRHTVTSFAG